MAETVIVQIERTRSQQEIPFEKSRSRLRWMIHGCRAILTGRCGDLDPRAVESCVWPRRITGYFRHIDLLFLKRAFTLCSVTLAGWWVDSFADGNSHTQDGAAQHPITGADSSGRHQHGPEASAIGAMCCAGGKSARLWDTYVACFAYQDPRAVERSARRRKRIRPRCELSATGQGRQRLSDRSIAVQPGKCLGNRRSARGLELRLQFQRSLRRRRREDDDR